MAAQGVPVTAASAHVGSASRNRLDPPQTRGAAERAATTTSFASKPTTGSTPTFEPVTKPRDSLQEKTQCLNRFKADRLPGGGRGIHGEGQLVTERLAVVKTSELTYFKSDPRHNRGHPEG